MLRSTYIGSVPAEALAAFARLSDGLGRAADEGRAAVESLRASTSETNALARAFDTAADEAALGQPIHPHLTIIGAVREMHPIVRDEVHRIGCEAIRNACIHSGGRNLFSTLNYGRDLTLEVRDDGRGIDPEVQRAGKSGHFGLVGMQERAQHIGGTFRMKSSTSGTIVTLFVPGRAIFKPRFEFPRTRQDLLHLFTKLRRPTTEAARH
jgi:signal transduction histidine kinase